MVEIPEASGMANRDMIGHMNQALESIQVIKLPTNGNFTANVHPQAAEHPAFAFPAPIVVLMRGKPISPPP
jgi:hypothetical protein